jgi:hypothetical protein
MDDEEAMAGSLSLDLDTSGAAPLPPAISQPSLPVPSGPVSQRSLPPTGVPAPTSGGSLAPGDRASMPVSGPVPKIPLEVDPFDARAVADYEPVPDGFLMTPLYAFRVMRRRSELRDILERVREKNERAQNEALDALVALGERLVPLVGGGLEQVQAAEQVLRVRDTALASEMDAHKGRLAEIEVRLATAENELAAAESAATIVQAELDEARQHKARIEAKMKRAEIEMRNAEAVGTELDLRPSQSSADELLHANAAIVAIEGRMTDARRTSSAAEARCGSIRAERKSENDRFQRQLLTRSSGFSEARDAYRNALADLARSLLGSAGVPAELEPLRKDAVSNAERAHKAAVDLRLHEVGIDSFDRGKVATGIGLSAALVFILVLLLFFPMIYRSFVNG